MKEQLSQTLPEKQGAPIETFDSEKNFSLLEGLIERATDLIDYPGMKKTQTLLHSAYHKLINIEVEMPKGGHDELISLNHDKEFQDKLHRYFELLENIKIIEKK